MKKLTVHASLDNLDEMMQCVVEAAEETGVARDILDEIQKISREYKLDLIKFADPTWNINL